MSKIGAMVIDHENELLAEASREQLNKPFDTYLTNDEPWFHMQDQDLKWTEKWEKELGEAPF